MPSTFSPNKNYELQATGENDGTWGVLLNANTLSLIDLNFGGRLAVTIDSANVTLTAEQQENVFITLTGTLTGNRDLIFTATAGGFFFIYNNTSGAFTVTAKPSGGTGVVVPQGGVSFVFISPTASSAFLGSTPSVMTTAGDLIYQGASAPARLAAGAQGAVPYMGASSVPAWLAPGTSGQALLSGGAAANPVWGSIGSNKASFSANKNNVDQAINTTVATQLTFGTEVFDVGGFFASNAWTPPSGTISLTATVFTADLGTASESLAVLIYKNGALYKASYNSRSQFGSAGASINIIDQANGTDNYTVWVQNEFTSTWGIEGDTRYTYFMGSMI